MSSIHELITAVQSESQLHELRFADVLANIKSHYQYTPAAFNNGPLRNPAGENEGSCIIFAFAILHDLTEEQALRCFAEHYQGVLDAPEGASHQNIRQFMRTGLPGISFASFPLAPITEG